MASVPEPDGSRAPSTRGTVVYPEAPPLLRSRRPRTGISAKAGLERSGIGRRRTDPEPVRLRRVSWSTKLRTNGWARGHFRDFGLSRPTNCLSEKGSDPLLERAGVQRTTWKSRLANCQLEIHKGSDPFRIGTNFKTQCTASVGGSGCSPANSSRVESRFESDAPSGRWEGGGSHEPRAASPSAVASRLLPWAGLSCRFAAVRSACL